MAGDYLSSREAAKRLGVSRATLYAYVSRGLIRSESVAGSRRTRRYRREDVRRLRERKEIRRDPGKAAQDALHWGSPVLDSALTLIDGGRFYYRGQDAIALSRSHSVEAVAALMWTGVPDFHQPLPHRYKRCRPTVEHLQSELARYATSDPAAYDLRPESVVQTGARIIRRTAALAAGPPCESVVETIRRGWGIRDRRSSPLLSAALILSADHELNPSSFTARVVAAAGATPYAVVIAGLSAMQGVRHGGTTGQIEALFREVRTPARARRVLSARLRRGETIPGFGHPLYPDGDPRGRELLRRVHDPLSDSIVRAAKGLIRGKPNIDLGLVALTRSLGLPEGTALILFALGRTVGWIGHAIEQYESPRLIRPRARYTGVPPA